VSKPEFPHFVWFRKSHDIPVYASIYIYMCELYTSKYKPETRNRRNQKPKNKNQKQKTKNQKQKKMPKKNNLPLYIYT